jgi:hypothetical protein
MTAATAAWPARPDHGLAFAGIPVDLGLDGAPLLLALLAFNVGV